MKHLLTLSYLGTAYSGFQVQPNAKTVQAALQFAATRIFDTPCGITGCSRTDSGVHANEYLAVIEEHGTASIPESAVARAMNTYLPKDISVSRCVAVADDFKIRREVDGKEYVYLIWNHPYRNPFLSDRALYYPRKLDLDAIQKAIPCFLGKHDFRAFMASGSDIADTVRTVTDLRVEAEGDQVKIYVSADGFLYNMVRIIVGTLLEISEGKISFSRLEQAIATGERSLAGRTAPAEGLYLNRVFLNSDALKREEKSCE
ncbi:MAG: tRNA pseudouridine(38-40) synthase TruA [Clostridia bacterium]|nr:tRNA pseudouridine(38-40) synthase TruA [Clostridia bacterium]